MQIENSVKGGVAMKLYCVYCTKEITPDDNQCPSCGTPYGLETLLLIKNLVREALSAHSDEHGKYDLVCCQSEATDGHKTVASGR